MVVVVWLLLLLLSSSLMLILIERLLRLDQGLQVRLLPFILSRSTKDENRNGSTRRTVRQ